VIYTGGLGIVQTFDWIVAAIVADDGFQATILVFTLLLGSGVAMVWNLGGTYAIRDWAIERLDTQRKAGLAAWVLGVILFFDDYANTAIVGSAMKDVSDQLRISARSSRTSLTPPPRPSPRWVSPRGSRSSCR